MDRNALRKTLTAQLNEVTGEIHQDLDDNLRLLEGLGLDSIDLVTLIVDIQGRFGFDLKGEELARIATVGDLLDVLLAKLGSRAAA